MSFALLLFLILTALSPLIFGQLMLTSLRKLHLDPASSRTAMIAMFFGGLINIRSGWCSQTNSLGRIQTQTN